ncbi:MAG: nucleotidyltransferase family protein [Bacteroidota bacterium]|jgi:predicted nucleotidyltransferase|nr:nucleotidyltransferase family protein [Cytophagales bacterium]MCE2956706.1 nucleotidyltransferase family protein [Flammeovirgaceae bacterium]MCZ8071274.1 nucleotidyltransferase family protein [Cytophagales bacterium]
MITQHQKEILLQHLKPLNPAKVAIFGSYSRGENRDGSDLDVLVFLNDSHKVSLLDLAGVELDLSDALGIKVDLVTERSLNPLVRPYVEKDLQFVS